MPDKNRMKHFNTIKIFIKMYYIINSNKDNVLIMIKL